MIISHVFDGNRQQSCPSTEFVMERRRFFVATEINLDDSKHLCYHEFEASDYRSIVSLNAFGFGVKKYNRSKTKLFHCKRKQEWIEDTSFWNGNKRLPLVIIHPSIWDFYTFIGYDYKKKKYVK